MAASLSIPSPVKAGVSNLPIAYLRAVLMLLVVAHHSVMAYFPKAPPVPVSLLSQPRWWQAFAVVDSRHFAGFGPFVLFNDTFLMALMFLLSGLFVWSSLERKGPVVYFKDRFLRLGVPFVIFALVAPFGYYPTYLQSRVKTGFWHEWMALGSWPAGAVWFIWLLLVFDMLAIAIFTGTPSTFQALSRKIGRQQEPYRILAGLFLLTAMLYVPMLLHFGPFGFWMWGPLYVQACRILYYPVYFLFGLALGASGEKTFLQPEGSLALHWRQWAAGAVAGFILLTATNYLAHHIYSPVAFWTVAVGTAFTLSSALSCFAFLAAFLHFIRRRQVWLDSLFACSYGIYLTHYAVAAWTQFSLLRVPAPPLLKGTFVFLVAMLSTWGLTLLARRSRLIARVI